MRIFKRRFMPGRMLNLLIMLLAVTRPLTTSSWAQDRCETTLAESQKIYEAGRFTQVIAMLNQCLPDGIVAAEKVKAYRLLAMAYLAEDYRKEAEEAIRKLLRLERGYQPHPIQDTEQFIALVEDVKKLLERNDPLVLAVQSTRTVKVYDAAELSKLPIRGVGSLFGLQPGISMFEGSGGADGTALVNARGGISSAVLYIVDGVAQNDPLFGGSHFQMSQDAIARVSFHIGGYEARYGWAQSGIVNITTKSGDSAYHFASGIQSSRFTDNFGYNLYTGSLSGPIIPKSSGHTFFLLGERGLFADGYPSAIGVRFATTDPLRASAKLPGDGAKSWRYTARTMHDFNGKAMLRLGADLNDRVGRVYVHRFAKSNSEHNPRIERNNRSYFAHLSFPALRASSLNFKFGYKRFSEKFGDGVFFDNVLAYGDTSQNPFLLAQGVRPSVDEVGIFYKRGRVHNEFHQIKNETLSLDMDSVIPIKNHLFEFGGGVAKHTLRYYEIAPLGLALNKHTLSVEQRFRNVAPFLFGYDVTGQRETKAGEKDPVDINDPFDNIDIAPKEPIVFYTYLQDRYELKPLLLNLGVRMDYYDTKREILRDENRPFQFGDPNRVDDADFAKVEPEVLISPRLGLALAVTATSVFHGNFGLYNSSLGLQYYVNDLPIVTGDLVIEKTTQHEFGFRQIFLDHAAAIDLAVFYKKSQAAEIARIFHFSRASGQDFYYYGLANTDFGTVRGMAFSLDVARQRYMSLTVNYTYFRTSVVSFSFSSPAATFRNNSGEIPRATTGLLGVDPSHAITIHAGFETRDGELGLLENVSLNVLGSYKSGVSYIALEDQDLLAGTVNYGDTRKYVGNSYGPSSFLLNMKLEKELSFGALKLRPFVWIENLLNAKNTVSVYGSTGSPYTTAFLNTDEGKKIVASRPNPAAYIADYETLERDPANFGIPRMIRLGVDVSFNEARP